VSQDWANPKDKERKKDTKKERKTQGTKGRHKVRKKEKKKKDGPHCTWWAETLSLWICGIQWIHCPFFGQKNKYEAMVRSHLIWSLRPAPSATWSVANHTGIVPVLSSDFGGKKPKTNRQWSGITDRDNQLRILTITTQKTTNGYTYVSLVGWLGSKPVSTFSSDVVMLILSGSKLN